MNSEPFDDVIAFACMQVTQRPRSDSVFPRSVIAPIILRILLIRMG